MKFIGAFCLFLCVFGLSFLGVSRIVTHNPYPEICHFVFERIYIEPAKLQNWMVRCQSRQKLVQPWSSKDLVLRDVNNILDLLKVSHLNLLAPTDVNKYWQGQVYETGVETSFVEGNLVVTQVHPGSPAEDVGFQVFDIIESIANEAPSEASASTEAGLWKVRRGDKTYDVQVTIGDFQKDDSLRVEASAEGVTVVRVPSFRASFFARQRWVKEIKKAETAKNLVLDLRGNVGGNFFAGVSLLSSFICEEKVIGSLVRPRFAHLPKGVLPPTLEDAKQVAELKKSSQLELRVSPQFAGSTCLPKPKAILVDAKTSSVAEMVALVLQENLRAPVMGSLTAGRLLVGLWYDWSELGNGVELSVPEALFVSAQGVEIEGRGVKPDRELYYRLKDVRDRKDSWLTQVL